jgi:serine/threonine protein kinase
MSHPSLPLAETVCVHVWTAVHTGAGLWCLQAHMLVHRDLKPANVLLAQRATTTPPWPFLKIADFGFARERDASGNVQGRYGSLLYMVRIQPAHAFPPGAHAMFVSLTGARGRHARRIRRCRRRVVPWHSLLRFVLCPRVYDVPRVRACVCVCVCVDSRAD